jgi:hypothetical protein
MNVTTGKITGKKGIHMPVLPTEPVNVISKTSKCRNKGEE